MTNFFYRMGANMLQAAPLAETASFLGKMSANTLRALGLEETARYLGDTATKYATGALSFLYNQGLRPLQALNGATQSLARTIDMDSTTYQPGAKEPCMRHLEASGLFTPDEMKSIRQDSLINSPDYVLPRMRALDMTSMSSSQLQQVESNVENYIQEEQQRRRTPSNVRPALRNDLHILHMHLADRTVEEHCLNVARGVDSDLPSEKTPYRTIMDTFAKHLASNDIDNKPLHKQWTRAIHEIEQAPNLVESMISSDDYHYLQDGYQQYATSARGHLDRSWEKHKAQTAEERAQDLKMKRFYNRILRDSGLDRALLPDSSLSANIPSQQEHEEKTNISLQSGAIKKITDDPKHFLIESKSDSSSYKIAVTTLQNAIPPASKKREAFDNTLQNSAAHRILDFQELKGVANTENIVTSISALRGISTYPKTISLGQGTFEKIPGETVLLFRPEDAQGNRADISR